MAHPVIERLREVRSKVERRTLVVERLVISLHPLPDKEVNGKQMKDYFRTHKRLKKQILKLIQ